MKRALFILMTFVVAFAPGCKKDVAPVSATINVKIIIKHEPPNITILDPSPDPARIAKGDKINWIVKVIPTGAPQLDVTIDGFKDAGSRPVDVFADGSTYRISAVSSGETPKASSAAAVASDAEGFKYTITAVSSNGVKKVLDPRIIVSAGVAHQPTQ